LAIGVVEEKEPSVITASIPTTAFVRGTFVLNTFDFVRERFGEDAHASVLSQLPLSLAYLLDIRDGSWVPLPDFVACMMTAREALAPADPLFYRLIGRYGGSHLRTLWVGILVNEPTMAFQFCKLLWRTFVDSGRVEVISYPGAVGLRVHDLPVSAPFCERLHGSLEGMLGLATMRMRVEKRACTSRGDPYCEMHVAPWPLPRQARHGAGV
jgi:hypothetical protein